MRPLHHGEPDPAAPPLQRIVDSDLGVLSADVLHTAGALLFTAGVAIYLYLAHVLRRDAAGRSASSFQWLTYAHAFTLVGIFLNGVGGLMRLFQSDHPGLDRLPDSVWVQSLLVKHLFLVLGVALAVYLTWRTRNLAAAQSASPERIRRESPRITAFAVGSLATILLATVLGSVAGNVDLAEDLGLPAASGDETPQAPDSSGPSGQIARLDTGGTITGSPLAPGAQAHRFTIPEGATALTVVLNWSRPFIILELAITQPAGKSVEGNRTESPTSIHVLVESNVPAGLWTLEVRSQRAAAEAYTLHALATPTRSLLECTVQVPGAAGFFEINLLMLKNRTLEYDWRVEGSSQTLGFNIHLHVGSNVEYPVQGEWNRLSGNYTHASADEGVSLLWENNGTAPLSVHYVVLGDFDVHSYAPETGCTPGVSTPTTPARASGLDSEGLFRGRLLARSA